MEEQEQAGRKGYVFYRSFLEALKEVDDKTFREVVVALSEYALDGIEPQITGVSKGFLMLMKPQIDANNKRYENGKKGASHGQKGGRPTASKPQRNPKETPTEPQTNPEETPNSENETPKEKDKDKDKVKEKDKEKDKDISPAEAGAHMVVDYLNERLKSHYRYSEATLKHIRARLREGFTVEDCKTVIDKKASGWQGSDMAKFLRPETLFGSKFESYLNEQPGEPKNKRDVLPDYYNADPDREYAEEPMSQQDRDELRALLDSTKRRE